MDKSVAYVAWVNPQGVVPALEVVGIRIKSIKGKVTLVTKHPAFPGLRLDLDATDFTPEDAVKRFRDQRLAVAKLSYDRYTVSMADAERADVALASGMYEVKTIEVS